MTIMAMPQVMIMANAILSPGSGKPPDIASLTSRVNDLTGSFDSWNRWMLWGLGVAAIAAIWVGLTTYMTIVRSKQLTVAQGDLAAAKEANLSLELKDKDVGIAKAQGDAATALATQQSVEIELNKQKERAANAEKTASDAALALARFREPRSLSPQQQQALASAAKPFTGQRFALAVFPDPEPQALAKTIDVVLRAAGWVRVPAQIQRDNGVLMEIAGETAAEISDSGMDAYIAPDETASVGAQSAFCKAILAAGIACETHRTPQLAGKTPSAITISVGKKP